MKQKLLLPSLLLMVAIAGVALFAIYVTTQRQLAIALRQRGQLIASMAQYAAEGPARSGELERIVSKLGADREALDIVVVGGTPVRVLASTRTAWRGRLLGELPKEEVADDLAGALRTQSSQAHFNPDQDLYDFTSPIELRDLASPSLVPGAVMVHLDTRPMKAVVANEALKLVVMLLLVMTMFGTFIYWHLNRLVLRPIAAIAERVEQHRLGVTDAVDTEGVAEDELGELARTLTAALARTDTAVRELADQKAALDEHSIVAVTDARGKITYVNDKFCKLSQYSREELLGQDHRIINSKHHPKEYIAELWRTLKAGQVWHGELKNRAKDGSYYWVDSTLVPLLGTNGSPTQFIAIRTDITEHKRAQEALIKAKAAAECASASKSEFLANMSHEIRTPMNAVIGMTSLLLDTPLDPKQRELVETVRRSSDALLGIINEVLDYSKIEAGRLELEQRNLQVRDIVESVIDLFATQANDKRLDLVYEIDADVPEWLIGDVMRVRQIVVNLVSNAIKFTSRGEVVVHVGCAEPADGRCNVTFSIRDTGIGIPKDQIGLLFQTFVQVDSSTTRRFGGTGLGLAISQRLASMMGGRIWVESVHQRGSTFFFSCPLQVSTISSLEEPNVALTLIRQQRVLVVDDNASSRAMLQRQIEAWGAEVVAVGSGREALRATATRGPFSILVVDHEMPELDGPALVELMRLRANVAMPPVVLVGSPHRGGLAARSGEDVAARVPKPVRPRALLQALALALGATVPARSHVSSPPGSDAMPLGDSYPLRVLLAEDNPVNQKIAALLLERIGYQVDLVDTGRQALSAATTRDYDLILMDVHMPDMDGLEAARSIRRQSQVGGHRPWIVAVTASALDTDRSATVQAGMDDFVSKPMRREDLEAMVLRLVHARESSAGTSGAAASSSSQEIPVLARQPLVDFAQLLANVSGCPKSANIVVSEFLRHVDSQLHAVDLAIGAGDGQQIRSAAHLHKSSLAAIQALPAMMLAGEIELAGKRGDIAQAKKSFVELSNMSTQIIGALLRWQASAATAKTDQS